MTIGHESGTQTTAGTWIQQLPGDFDGVRSGIVVEQRGLRLQMQAGRGTYTSPVKQTPFAYMALGIRWAAETPEGLDVELRTSRDGATWSAWTQIQPDDLQRPGAPLVTGELYVVAPDASFFQYRLTLYNQATLVQRIETTYLDARPGPSEAEAVGSAQRQPRSVNQPLIINRASWGANESYRYDSGGSEIWPPEYRTVTKLIVHHTETANFEADPAATVRAVYYYHAITLKWGDIGYNYLVDWHGNIYQGRYGGQGVVGGHALRYNYGSSGVAALGSFTSTGPSASMATGLKAILTWLADLHTINPLLSSYFIDKSLPNLMGHRDCLQTACPGDILYAQLPNLRTAIYNTLYPHSIHIPLILRSGSQGW